MGDEPRPDQAEVRRKGMHKYRKLAADPRYAGLLAVLHRFLARAVPMPRRRELSYWAVSARPATGDGSRLLTLSVHQLETFIAAGNTIAVNVDGAILRARWGTLDALMDAIPGENSAMVDLAAGHADRGEDEAAIELYERAIAAAVPRALQAYGFYWRTRGDLDRAETYCRRAVEQDAGPFASCARPAAGRAR
jgi:hypothetical protein